MRQLKYSAIKIFKKVQIETAHNVNSSLGDKSLRKTEEILKI